MGKTGIKVFKRMTNSLKRELDTDTTNSAVFQEPEPVVSKEKLALAKAQESLSSSQTAFVC